MCIYIYIPTETLICVFFVSQRGLMCNWDPGGAHQTSQQAQRTSRASEQGILGLPHGLSEKRGKETAKRKPRENLQDIRHTNKSAQISRNFQEICKNSQEIMGFGCMNCKISQEIMGLGCATSKISQEIMGFGALLAKFPRKSWVLGARIAKFPRKSWASGALLAKFLRNLGSWCTICKISQEIMACGCTTCKI